MSTFLEEMDEHVSVLNRDLLRLEKTKPDEDNYDKLLRSIFRTVHSLKGAARSVDLTTIEKTCHQMEELFSQVREGQKVLEPPVFRVLFATADGLAEAGHKLRNRIDFKDSSTLSTLIDDLNAAINDGLPDRPAADMHSNGGHGLSNVENGASETIKGEMPELTETRTEPELTPEFRNDLDVLTAATTWTQSQNNRTESSIKIAANKLDRLLAQSSELLTVYRRTEDWLEKLSGLHDYTKRWQDDWRSIEQPLRDRLSETQVESRASIKPFAEANSGRIESLPKSTGESIKSVTKQLDRMLTAMKSDIRVLSETARQVDEEIRTLRMRPFSELCLGMERTARDIASISGKDVQVIVQGADVELDRSILDKLKSPLTHLLRNAVQHGIENVTDRLQKQKNAMGTITVSAALRGSQVEITIEDDGRGIDLQAIKARAKQNGLAEPQNEQDAAELIFMPGFSTSETVNEIAGRGVGLDVVASELLDLQGSIQVSSGRFSGTCFTLTVPLTLTKIRALFVKVEGQVYAFSSANIEMLLRVNPADIMTMQGREVLSVRGRFVPIATLAEALKIPSQDDFGLRSQIPIVVVRHGNNMRAYAVDELLTEQEVVVTNLGARLLRVRNISGATIMPSGQVALIINSADLLRRTTNSSVLSKGDKTTDSSAQKRKRLILCDDSITTRMLETSILESAGYDVTAVSDGADAWELLKQQGADLIVSDVEMPKMDGFTLTRTIRGSSQWSDLPVILVTGLGRERDRARGIEVGATAYVVKGDFDQTELLETIAQLV